MQMERIARILSHLAFPVCQCVSSPPGVPWSFLRPDPSAPPCSFQLLLPAAPLLLFFRTVSPVCLPARCRLSVCLPVWVLSVLHLIFICFYFPFLPAAEHIFLFSLSSSRRMRRNRELFCRRQVEEEN